MQLKTVTGHALRSLLGAAVGVASSIQIAQAAAPLQAAVFDGSGEASDTFTVNLSGAGFQVEFWVP
jgi:hypothetical protein